MSTTDQPKNPADEKKTPPPGPGEGGSDAGKPAEKTPEELKKEEHLANLDKAITEATGELNRIRTEQAEARKGPAKKEGEDELPRIDEDDPSSKAWNKRIQETVAPVNAEIEGAKAEVRRFALTEFLADKPALARNPEKVKELVQYYERIRTATERTKEGVLLDLKKAYAVVFADEILDAARSGDVARARVLAGASEIAVDQGATGYQKQTPTSKRSLSAEDRTILAKWGITEEEWQADHAKYGGQQ